MNDTFFSPLSAQTVNWPLLLLFNSNKNIEEDCTKFDRVYKVYLDSESFMNCSCGYVNQYLAPCQHIFAVLADMKHVTADLFHIRWWKHFNYYFASPDKLKANTNIHKGLVVIHNVLNEKSFRRGGKYKGCYLGNSTFPAQDQTYDSSSKAYLLMTLMEKYIHERGPICRGDDCFVSYNNKKWNLVVTFGDVPGRPCWNLKFMIYSQ